MPSFDAAWAAFYISSAFLGVFIAIYHSLDKDESVFVRAVAAICAIVTCGIWLQASAFIVALYLREG